MIQTIFYIAIGFTIFCVLTLMMVPVLMRPNAEMQRFFQVVASARLNRRSIGRKERFEEGLLSLAHDLRARVGMRSTAKLRTQLLSAGFRGNAAADVFLAAQFLIPLVAIIGASFIPQNTLFWIVALTAIGYIAPSLCLTEMIRRRKNRIRHSLPDAIDLMVICVDAGLGLDQAILRVADELALSHPDLQEELSRVHLEQRAGRPRLEAWQNMANRTQIVELTAFVSMLTQTDRFGTPIIRALSRFADDLRLKRRQRAEEGAAKTRIKIVFPLVFCIFPCLFIILLAPAMLAISTGLKGTGQ